MKHAKKAFLASLLSVVLCVTMLVGTTYAWFTDSVTSAGNVIKSGTLDVEFSWIDATKALDSDEWKDASEGAIFNYDLWEPGYVAARRVKIENVGSLALHYQLRVLFNGNPEAGAHNLAEAIDVYYLDEAVQIPTRDAFNAYVSANNIQPVALSAVLSNINGAASTSEGNLYPAGTAGHDSAHEKTIVLKMRESAGNEYQNLGLGATFSVQLLATQLSYENDSFGPDYDDLADETPDYANYFTTHTDSAQAVVPTSGSTVIEVYSAPQSTNAAGEANTTTIEIDEGLVTPGNTVDFDAATGEYEIASETKFEVTGDSVAVATIDLTLVETDAVTGETTMITDFGDKKSKVTTSVLPGLTNVFIIYDGDAAKTFGTSNPGTRVATEAELDAVGEYYYDAETGYLAFYTDHLSVYHTATSDLIYNVTAQKGYTGLKAAIQGVGTDRTEEIVLLSDIQADNNCTLYGDVVLNLNQHTLRMATRKITLNAGVSIALKDGQYIARSSMGLGNNQTVSFDKVDFVFEASAGGQAFQMYGKSNLTISFLNSTLLYAGTPTSNMQNYTLLAFTGSDTNCTVSFVNSPIQWTETVPIATFSTGTDTSRIYFDEASINLATALDRVWSRTNKYNIVELTADDGMTCYKPVTAAKWTDVVTAQPEDYLVDVNGNISIGSSEALAWFAKQASTSDFAGKTITLTADVNMSGYDWTPIYCANGGHFAGTFDGGNHVISRIVSKDPAVSGYGNGLFYSVTGAVQNLTVRKATIGTSDNYNIGGVITGYAYGTVHITNVSVEDSVVNGYGKLGGMVGMSAEGGTITFTNCSVSDTQIKGYYNGGGYIGLAQNAVVFDNCTVDASWEGTFSLDNEYVEQTVAGVTGLYWTYGDDFYAAWSNYYNDYDEYDDHYIGLCHN